MGAKGLGSRAIIGEFYARLEQDLGTTWIPLISNLFQSDMESETYKWLGMVPAMREWIGGRQAKGFRENGLTIINKKFEATMEVVLDEIRRDKTDQVMIRVGELAQRVNAHWAKLLCALITAGKTGYAYDGKRYFAANHTEGDSGTLKNLITPACADDEDITVVEFEAAILQAVEALYNLKDDQGEPINENARQFLVLVGPQHFSKAAAALQNPVIVGSGQARTSTLVNLSGYLFQLAVSARLSAVGATFYVFRTDADTRAFIRQEEEALTISAVAEGSELEFNEDKHHYGVKAIRNVGYGMWQRAIECDFAETS
jgi:phage major head subunit gpT-like protein